MDPLSDIIALLRPNTAVSKPITANGRWSICYRAYDAPGFTLVLRGKSWIEFEGMAPLRLSVGDYLLLPSIPAFKLYSEPGVPCGQQVPVKYPVQHGDKQGEADFESIGGTFALERINASLLQGLLPGFVHVPASQGRAGRLGQLIELITDECNAEGPGKEMVLQRLLEVMLIEALRWENIAPDRETAGLLHAMRDPVLARVLRAIHADVRTKWTVAELARVAGMSRSAFAARFGEMLGCGPIEYLSRWRIVLAKDALVAGRKRLDRIADEIGYGSASAFSTAFRKRLGCSPGRFARANRGDAA